MADNKPSEEPREIRRPLCEDCGVEMWLVKVVTEPGEIQIFKCPVCQAKALN